ncbi:hypothetical protein JTE90_028459 [Oedothorax gibbosus]|uniref:Uncharacterized protein n=1 Tax=Oedothorax gibbosus TaxID=931172 RepID=A0AAV6VF13_9ARAC|nr:hypothetical protein JTE90_028459 [Oedothorax gibbosus]
MLCSSSPIIYWVAAMAILPTTDRSRFKLQKEHSYKTGYQEVSSSSRKPLSGRQLSEKLYSVISWPISLSGPFSMLISSLGLER